MNNNTFEIYSEHYHNTIKCFLCCLRRFVDVLLKSAVNLRTKSVHKCVYFCVRAFAVHRHSSEVLSGALVLLFRNKSSKYYTYIQLKSRRQRAEKTLQMLAANEKGSLFCHFPNSG